MFSLPRKSVLRPRRPRFGLPWLALALGAATAAFAAVGVGAITSEPQARITIVVEDGLPLNITQETVDAAHAGPIRSWEPLTFRVTADLLSRDELNGNADAGADVLLSTAIEDSADPREPKRFSGAAVRSAATDPEAALSDRHHIGESYLTNVGLGHGPLAVVASARTAAQVLTDGPIRTPVFWVAGTGIGVLLTGAALTLSLRRRMRWESRYRRLAVAQRKLARVVLDLEALEATYVATPQRSRPKGFTAAWEGLREGTLQMARREDAVVEAVSSRETALRPATAELVSGFESGAGELTRLADALLAAGAVHSRLAGGTTTFDRLAAPLNDAARELLVRMEAAPGGTVPAKGLHRLSEAHGALLSVAAQDHGTGGSATGVLAWTRAEKALAAAARSISKALRRHPHGRILPRERSTEDLTELRASLGLPKVRSGGALAALDRANATARALLGDVAAYDGSTDRGSASDASTNRGRAPDEQPSSLSWVRLSWIRRAGGGVAAVVVSMLAAGLLMAAQAGLLTAQPDWELTGNEDLRSLSIDGRADVVAEDEIRQIFSATFPQPLDLTLAVRDAEEYLKIKPGSVNPSGVALEPAGTLGAILRVKDEFPQLADPATHELRPDQAIMLVMVFDDGGVGVPATLTGAVAEGADSRLGPRYWTNGGLYIATDHVHIHLASELYSLARGLQSNGFPGEESGGALLFWLLTAALTLALLTGARVIQYGGNISAGLGRFGRRSDALRRAREQLDRLALGLGDSRLNAVAVLGAGPAATAAEADQRLFERALVMGWREAEGLEALPLSSRLSADYAERVAHLERLVATLGERDADVERRTRALLEATRGAGGGTPG